MLSSGLRNSWNQSGEEDYSQTARRATFAMPDMKGKEAAVPRLNFAVCPARIPPTAEAILPEAYHVRIKNAIVGQPRFCQKYSYIWKGQPAPPMPY